MDANRRQRHHSLFSHLVACAGLCLFSTSLKAEKIDPAPGPVVYTAPSEIAAINTATALAVSLGGRVGLTDGGASMAPLIPARAAVVVRDDFAAATVGDVLIYSGSCSPRATRKPLCHRATARDAGGFIMRGDGNALAETWQRVTAANYLGTVLAVVNFP